MTIEGVSRLGPPALDFATERSPTPQPTVQPNTWNEGYAAQADGTHRPRMSRTAQPGLSHLKLQNAPTARARISEPDATWSDGDLVDALKRDYGSLHAYLKEGRLTYSVLCRVAAE